MEERVKRRLIGAAVLVSLVVIFVPMLLEDPVVLEHGIEDSRIPQKPRALQHTEDVQTILPEPIERVEPAVVEPETETVETAPTDDDRRSGKIERDTPSAWLIQVASFSNRENADRLVEKMRQAGLPARQKQVKIDGKVHFRVQMLPQLDKKQVDSLVKRISDLFGLKASVIRYTGE